MNQIFLKFNLLLPLLVWNCYSCSDSLGGLTGTSGTRQAKSSTSAAEHTKPSSAMDASQNNPGGSDTPKNGSDQVDGKNGTNQSLPGGESSEQTKISPSSPSSSNNNSMPSSHQSPFQACNSSAVANQPIVAKVYQLPVNTPSIAANAWTPSMYKSKICMQNFNIAPRSFDLGFPGIPGLFEWFGLDARAKIVVSSTGLYKFRLLSDDGAILFIDNMQIINHDNTHSPSSREGSVNLTAGTHDLKILYFQGPKFEIALQLFWTPPSMTEQVVPSSVFRYSDF